MTEPATAHPGAGSPGDRLVVYTCVFGEGYQLSPVSGPGEFLAFTDREDLEPRGWTVTRVAPLLPGDSARSSREQKIRGHRWLPDHERSLYVDPTVELLGDPESVWHWLTAGSPDVWFGAIRHSARATVLDEFAAVLGLAFDAPERLHEHLRALTLTEPKSLTLRPVWGGMMARRHHDPRCVGAMEDWFAQVLRYSRRDQLSLPGVIERAAPQGVHLIDADNRGAGLHSWPRPGFDKPGSYVRAVTDELVPAVLLAEREGRRRRELEDIVLELRSTVAALKTDLAAAELLREQARTAADRRLSTVQAERDRAVQRRDAVTASRSWRWTRGLRAARTRSGGKDGP